MIKGESALIARALEPVLEDLGITSGKPLVVPYHGAEAVQMAVRAVIPIFPPRTSRPMSANLMIKLLVDHGLPEAMANKLPSQIRKGASLSAAWKTVNRHASLCGSQQHPVEQQQPINTAFYFRSGL